MSRIFEIEDEIESIEYIGEKETIDIDVSGNRLFYANDILVHNSSIDEPEFSNSMIAGGISKVNTADNLIGIYSSLAMRESGRIQIQFMKTRSSSGVGQKVNLAFDVDSLRISDLDEDEADAETETASRLHKKMLEKQSKEENSKDKPDAIQKVIENSDKLKKILQRD